MKLPAITSEQRVLDLVRDALAEDIGTGDATTLALVDDDARVRATLLAREPCVVSGAPLATVVFSALDPELACKVEVPDGEHAGPGDTVLSVEGAARSILTAERTALNFMQRMTGIATLTSRFVEAVQGSGAIILDTRKTTPGLRLLEKYAVLCGGGVNHRTGLYDRILIKDNHRRLWREGDPSRLDEAVTRARDEFPGLEIEIEVENEDELRSALRASPEWVLLDNMSTEQTRRCVDICAGATRLEASGGITLENVAEMARTGVDAISLGCLTHSAPSADLSLEIAETVPGSDAQ